MIQVSVIMGVYYQCENIDLLQRAVFSILNQQDTDLELLICDDGSTVDAINFLNTCAAADARVRLIRPGGAVLLPQKLNHCLRQARGEYIARMDDDDYSHPDRLREQLLFLNDHSDTAFVGSCVNLVQNNKTVGIRHFPAYPAVKDFYMTQPYIHPSLVFRRECLLSVGGYSEESRCVLCEDYDLLLRLYHKGFRGANLREALLDYTIPLTAHGSRTMRHRWNETVTRWVRFRELGVLPKALPYVVKPLAVGLIPEKLLRKLKGN